MIDMERTTARLSSADSTSAFLFLKKPCVNVSRNLSVTASHLGQFCPIFALFI